MSEHSSNDNAPAEPLPMHVEMAHAINALAHHEHQIRRMVMVPLPAPNGPKPLGEILMRLGQALMDKEKAAEPKSRLILPPNILRP